MVVQGLRHYTSIAGDMGLIPGWGTKILHAMQYSKKKNKNGQNKKKNPNKQKHPSSLSDFSTLCGHPQSKTPRALCSVLTCQMHARDCVTWCQHARSSALPTTAPLCSQIPTHLWLALIRSSQQVLQTCNCSPKAFLLYSKQPI